MNGLHMVKTENYNFEADIKLEKRILEIFFRLYGNQEWPQLDIFLVGAGAG
ncbi:MAG: hypothetical protein AAF915_30230 [Cyanobacteria bacterium P01_D01_bin.50]